MGFQNLNLLFSTFKLFEMIPQKKVRNPQSGIFHSLLPFMLLTQLKLQSFTTIRPRKYEIDMLFELS